MPIVFDKLLGKPLSHSHATELDTRYLKLTYTPTAAVKPSSNSTTALQFQNATGVSILNIDTTNQRVGIGRTDPAYMLDVGVWGSPGSIMARGQINENSSDRGVQIGYGPGNDSPRFWLGNGNASQNWQIDNLGGTMRFFTPNNTHMTMTSTGRIGIGTTVPNTRLHVNGSVSVGVTTKTANYTMTTSDCVILADAAAAAFTVTLPSAANTGMIVYIKKVDSSANAVTISRAGTDTIEGTTTVPLLVQYSSRALVANGGSMWLVIAST